MHRTATFLLFIGWLALFATCGPHGTDTVAGTGGAAAGTGGVNTTGSGGAGISSCTFSNVMATLSPMIATVGIVTWSVNATNLTEAHIDFGLTTSYGLKAPVDLAAANYRTLLLGMKPVKTYHYRIVATNSSGTCTGEDRTIMTGPKLSGLPVVTVTTMNAAKVSGGFLITGQYATGPSTAGAPAYILDADGEMVWWFGIGSDVTGARMSYDGKYMWINKANVPDTAGANVHRVSMDGMINEDLTDQFTGLNHQLAVLPDETVAFYAYGANGCDDVKERAPDGTVKTIVNSMTATGVTGMCHLNNIQYSPMDNTLVFSDLEHSQVVKVTRSGQTVWILGGPSSQFGTNIWSGYEHGIHLLDTNRLIIFNNASMATGSSAIELMLNTTGTKTATKVWTYTANPHIYNQIMGDVQRMPNGNTIVAYSTQGVLHEVDSSGALVQELELPLGSSFGYIEKRPTLYGPPPR
jgi:hypothetical protein